MPKKLPQSFIDVEYKPNFNRDLSQRNPCHPRLCKDKYCEEQAIWRSVNCCIPKIKPKPCCPKPRPCFGVYPNIPCIQGRNYKENNKTMAALSKCLVPPCNNRDCYGPYYSLSGPVFHPPGLKCQDYSLYIPTERILQHVKQPANKQRLRKKNRNWLYPSLLNMPLGCCCCCPNPCNNPYCNPGDCTPWPKQQCWDPSFGDSSPNNCGASSYQNYAEYHGDLSEDAPEEELCQSDCQKLKDVKEVLQKHNNVRLDGKSNNNKSGRSSEDLKGPSRKESSTSSKGESEEGKARNEGDDQKAPRPFNNGNHHPDCTCSMCRKRRGGSAWISAKITDQKGERCRKLWKGSHRDPCHIFDFNSDKRIIDAANKCAEGKDPCACTNLSDCPCPVCCRRRDYSRIKPHSAYANGLSNPSLQYKKLTFSETTTAAGSNSGDITDEEMSPSHSPGGKATPPPYSTPEEDRDENAPNFEYKTDPSSKENPCRRAFGLDVTYRQMMEEEMNNNNLCCHCPNYANEYYPELWEYNTCFGLNDPRCVEDYAMNYPYVRPSICKKRRRRRRRASACQCELDPSDEQYCEGEMGRASEYRGCYSPYGGNAGGGGEDGWCENNPRYRRGNYVMDPQDCQLRSESFRIFDMYKGPINNRPNNASTSPAQMVVTGCKKCESQVPIRVCHDKECEEPLSMELRRIKWPQVEGGGVACCYKPCYMFERYSSCGD